MLIRPACRQHYVISACAVARLASAAWLPSQISTCPDRSFYPVRPFTSTSSLPERRTRHVRLPGDKIVSHNLVLLDALKAHGIEFAAPTSNKVDHTFIKPFDLFLDRLSGPSKQSLNHSESGETQDAYVARVDLSSGRHASHHRFQKLGSDLEEKGNGDILSSTDIAMSLKMVLADFIQRHLNDNVLDTLGKTPQVLIANSDEYFDRNAIRYLKTKGYNTEDVLLWLWVLTARDTFTATARLLAAGNRTSEGPNATLPPFILMTLLRRARINAASLRLLWAHALTILRMSHNPQWPSLLPKETYAQVEWCLGSKRDKEVETDAVGRRGSQTIGEDLISQSDKVWPPLSINTVVVMLIRFMRHARKVWPELLPRLGQVIKHHITASRLDKDRQMSRAVLNFVLNKMLALAALPSADFYSNIRYHQRAMYKIVRTMMKFNPPLLISREGHRAIIRLQLANRKTAEEEEWARLKSLSWPPWQQPQLGIDDRTDTQKGVSRAAQALTTLQKSGYELRNWDETAKVLSGWDTDNSPTIQSRESVHTPPSFNQEDRSRFQLDHDRLWAARIRATRTAEEAWKTFNDFCKSCRDHNPRLRPIQHQLIYEKMFQKLIYQEYRQLTAAEQIARSEPPKTSDNLRHFIPGDDLQVTASPRDPRLRPYLETPLPSVRSFFDEAVTDGLRVDGYLLCLLLGFRASYSVGRKILEHSTLEPRLVRGLLALENPPKNMLSALDNHVFAAVISWLTGLERHWSLDTINAVRSNSWQRFKPVEATRAGGLAVHAFRLLCLSGKDYEPAWLVLLNKVFRQASHLDGENDKDTMQALWSIFNRLVFYLRQTDEVAEYFLPQACRMFSAATANGSIMNEVKKDKFDILSIEELKITFEGYTGTPLRRESALNLLKAELGDCQKSLAKQANMEEWPLFRVPDTGTLHWFARALALSGDHKGIVQFVLWLQRYHPMVKDRAQSDTVLVECALAIRMGLERVPARNDEARIDKEALAGVQRAVEALEGSDTWPTDVDLDEYSAMSTRTLLQRMG